jgi:flagellar basal-body rod modification protein FlgD
VAIESITTAANVNGEQPALPKQTVSQDDFLKLLIAQLKNQDPLQPMDNQQFAVQLATFNSLEQLIGINDKLGTLQGAEGMANRYSAAALIGKEISSSGNIVNLQEKQPATIGYRLGANAAKVVVNIQNGSGTLVRQLSLGARNAGDHSIVWDGKDAAGQAAPAGLYGFEINAFDVNGRAIAASGQVRGTVTGVHLDGSEPVLEVGGLQIPLSQVSTIGAAR